MKHLMLIGGLLVPLFTSSCYFLTKEDRDLTRLVIERPGSGCVYITGQGGAGGGVPGVPAAGGWGSGTISVARTAREGAEVKCGPEGSSVDGILVDQGEGEAVEEESP